MRQGRVDFRELAGGVMREGAEVGEEQLTVCGSEISMEGWRAAWPDLRRVMGFKYAVLACLEEIKFLKAGSVDRWPDDLLWARVFGPGGDFYCWRDGPGRLRWRVIGPPGLELPGNLGPGKSLWEEEKKAKFFVNEEAFLLWGQYDGKAEAWQERRVAAADLKYPVDFKGRVKLLCRVYSRRGRVELVWYCDLVEEGEKNAAG
ncbi:hypothetical protein [Desulforamulus putei]|uniref:Uncharacterized protein n=1 Tax=Desulforamulus putei DSM 12395 TaxID=1121429 RepID=A0A1M4SH73_9FIRM|nr:hypothetical protein [Desulforamulus putei]SHE31583.1 hypothetical protein SAMN02745133_00120 [Desulforamulus putei DSM 12395]